MEEITSPTEEFLECTYRLQERNGVAKTGQLVKMLRVVPGTVTNTVKRLEEMGLVIHEAYRGIRLTEKGRNIALQVVRRHRLSERLLTDILHMDWDNVHEPACLLEHSITDEVAEKIERVLGNPRTCPHGNPIPTELGVTDEDDLEPLTALKSGEKGIVRKITDESRYTLERIKKRGLKPGTLVEVLSENPTTIRTAQSQGEISPQIASAIRVERFNGRGYRCAGG